ncbi:adenine phosphoribosyltransferase [Candidatus Shapirobacteria bacterium CG09_land_8_20_14_0_10_39_12]|uniref:Adenine phosphoribosyltransferase n=1 Tax=Candidatus Shapirobacteria bacterium CG09_land_8_20_14_0_10_39_12 TaxID=1974885 RepID=A0A2H0WNZ2_9BACT|nr:MAG: adenine phosphoribosyltransferase [Candidatus Shapirobacteria bacterium CG09_land_8_20_14_0_10_39_12]
MDLKKKIRNVPDFPEKGIIFRDIGPLLEDKNAFKFAVDELLARIGRIKIDKVVGIDARGFILAGVLAKQLNAGMVMIRKKGKLPFETEVLEYDLEYGKSILEIHKDSIKKGEKVLLVDDVLATGGTMSAAVKLVEKVGGRVEGIIFLIILDYLSGRKVLKDYNLISLVNYT